MTQAAFDPEKHIPVTVDNLPKEVVEASHDRPDIPPPSPWARTAVVVHRRTKQQAVVHRVDLMTRQMRLWYPDRANLPLEEQFDSRRDWQSLDEWEPQITFSPAEVERQQAAALFELELESFDKEGLALVTIFCDDPDPVKRLQKIRALKLTNLVRQKDADAAPAEVMAPVEPPPEPVATRNRTRKAATNGEEG